MKNTQLIVALDVGEIKKARELVGSLSPKVRFFKVGGFLFTSCGPDVVRLLKEKKLKVFLDLKLYDIPNTVANTTKAITNMGVDMFTIHASGGEEMMRACVEAAQSQARLLKIEKPKIVAVTVLTSSEQACVKDRVLELAGQALSCGVDGLVCSVQEASQLRGKFSNKPILVCPGIRPANSAAEDQKRVATPEQARDADVDFIVVGRPIIDAGSPVEAAVNILNALNQG